MFYKQTVTDHIRVPPEYLNLSTKDAVLKRIKKKYEGYISQELGIVSMGEAVTVIDSIILKIEEFIADHAAANEEG